MWPTKALGLAQMAKDHRWNQRYHQDWYRYQKTGDGTNHRARIGTGAKGPFMELAIVPRWQRTIDGTNNNTRIGTCGKGPAIEPAIASILKQVAKDHRQNQKFPQYLYVWPRTIDEPKISPGFVNMAKDHRLNQ